MSTNAQIIQNNISNPEKTNNSEKKDRKKPHHSRGFVTYIHKVLKLVHPDSGITQKAASQLNEMIIVIANAIYKESLNLVLLCKKQTISSREIQSSVRILLPGELARHAVGEGTKAITKFNASESSEDDNKKSKKKAEMREHRAGLIFSVSKCEKYLRGKGASSFRVGSGAPIYLAAVLEYLTAEILELGGNSARDNNKVIIKTRHIFLSITNDEELSFLAKVLNIEFADSGVIPCIHSELISSEKKKHKKGANAANDEESVSESSSEEKKKPKKVIVVIKGESKPNNSGIRRPHRFRPGTVALREIRKYQKSTGLILQKLPFERNLRAFAEDIKDDIRFSEGVPENIQGFMELRMVNVFTEAQKLAIHAGRKGITSKDMKLAFKKVVNNKLRAHSSKTKLQEEVPKASLRHLSRRGGVKIIGGDVYEEAESQMATMMQTLIGVLCTITEHKRLTTINVETVKAGLESLNYNYIF